MGRHNGLLGQGTLVVGTNVDFFLRTLLVPNGCGTAPLESKTRDRLVYIAVGRVIGCVMESLNASGAVHSGPGRTVAHESLPLKTKPIL